ncbi:hypothetical protein Y592_00305 [Thermosipho sp. 1070]|nr:hypothetical protein Y592_00305 [Thermosipho sp. 1070]
MIFSFILGEYKNFVLSSQKKNTPLSVLFCCFGGAFLFFFDPVVGYCYGFMY